MTASPNDNPPDSPENVTGEIPGAFDILLYSLTLTKRFAGELYGFAGYLFFPLLLLFGIQGLTGVVGDIASAVVNVLFVALSCWATAAMMTPISYRTTHPKKAPDPRSVGTHAMSVLSWLLIAVFLSALIQFAGYILLIIPGIIATVLLTFTSEEVVLGGHGPISALAASRARVQANFWPIAWRLLAIVLAFVIVYTAVGSAIVSIGSSLTDTPLESLLLEHTPLWLDVLLTVVQIIILPPMIAAHTVLYLSTNSGKVGEKPEGAGSNT
ncbi:MAG: hypothetical protein AAB839_03070 [Patescibacteria group bacterium]